VAFAAAVAVLAAVAAVGCAPPDRGAGAPGARLYVVNGAEASASLVDPGSGRGLGAVPVPRGTQQGVAGRAGSDEGLLTLAAPAGELTLLRRSGREDAWASRPVALEPAAVARLIAGDGARHAAAAYALRSEGAGRPGPACRLALIGLSDAAVERTLTVCTGERDSVQALALERGPDGPIAYVALWRQATPGAGPGGARLAAVHLPTGAVRASAPLPGVPEQVLVAPAPDGAARRLYAVSAVPNAVASRDGSVAAEAIAAGASEWRLTGLDPDTLRLESEQRLPYPPLWLGVTPDGRRAFAVAGPTSLLTPSALLRIDLLGGSASLLGAAPGRAMGLAVTGDRLFLADPEGNGLWVTDHRGRLARTVRVGRHPVALALSEP
jgi:hypothetical protein